MSSVVVTTRGIAPGAHKPTTAAVMMLRPRKALAVGRTVAPGARLHHGCIRLAAARTSAVVRIGGGGCYTCGPGGAAARREIV
eukprot:CAMPEP_0183350700 /NCGR_PEP_ID=MMETSP0164_2-20130417/20729_1 /TAXON_ID=221442 /ORGANISM="Coccolithus pelagicus ssp braarudi, Strain PLY182g" /LENGTH=82 /DNA_ID=CAMNT_0025522677 /DNA_START=192 /DNA_END=441 /DNA_ORIENTATION=+